MKDKPIVNKMTDAQDLYIYTIGFHVWLMHRQDRATFALTNRTRTVKLARRLDLGRLREELAHVRTLGHTQKELAFLRQTLAGFLSQGTVGTDALDEYMQFLANLRLCEPEIGETKDGDLAMSFDDKWHESLFWEILGLSLTNETFYDSEREREGRSVTEEENEGLRRLFEKILLLRKHPNVRFLEFGTRRRASYAWHRLVLKILADCLPSTQLLGTSCVGLGMDLGLKEGGTNAHQQPMAFSAIYRGDGSVEAFNASQLRVLDEWWDLYGPSLATMLPDTYTTGHLFKILKPEHVQRFTTYRQDSGQPEAFAEQLFALLRRYDVDPSERRLLFSDGLTTRRMIELADKYHGRITTLFGCGTHLTNDRGPAPLSIVIKPVIVNGLPVVKLSDNPEKATGDPGEIARVMRLIGATQGPAMECVY